MLATPQYQMTAHCHRPPQRPDPSRTRVQRVADPPSIWRKLATAVPVSRPTDPAEREAERAAGALVRGDSVQVSKTSPPTAAGAGAAVQRRCAACEEDEKREAEGGARVQRTAETSQTPAHAAPPAPAQPITSGGEPLSRAVRDYFEPRLGADLGAVRIHGGAAAAASARQFAARAYTYGQHIVVGSPGLDPDAPAGRHLLAHELAHTVQQSGSGAPALQRQPDEKKKHDWTEDWWPPHFKPTFPDSPIEIPGTQDLLGACRKLPSLPGCGAICKLYGCNEPPSSKTVCPPGFTGSTATDFKDQCCKDGQPASAQNCCPKERVGDGRCCGTGEVALGGHCTKPGPVDPGGLCLPGQRSPSGECCTLPKVPGAWGCEEPQKPPPPLIVDTYVDHFKVLFKQDQPRVGQPFESALAEGRGELDAAITALKKDLSTGAQLEANASQEGAPDHNQALSDRRLAAVQAEMKDVIWKVRDPQPPLGNVQGCRGSWGAYSCGEKNADQKTAQASDRNLIIRTFRPTEIKPTLPSVTPWPPTPWTGPTKPVTGNF